ncbi:HD domain-containing protein [Candidatus Woesearchaeota archaeon]|nr:HD domain-containing protein [Candidatus Woesearchaeota archaeon]
MDKISEKEAIRLLKKYSSGEKDFRIVLGHSRAVQRLALRIGKDIPNINLDFIRTASLLHDIGRFKKKPKTRSQIRHGIEGADILRKEGLPYHALVAERHLGAGISKEDIKEQGLDLPVKDYIPIRREEKIIACADNLIFNDRIGTVKEVMEKYRKKLGMKTGTKVGNKIKRLAEEVEGMKKE